MPSRSLRHGKALVTPRPGPPNPDPSSFPALVAGRAEERARKGGPEQCQAPGGRRTSVTESGCGRAAEAALDERAAGEGGVSVSFVCRSHRTSSTVVGLFRVLVLVSRGLLRVVDPATRVAELFLVLFLVTHVLSVTLSLSTAPGRHGSGSRSRPEEQDFELSNLKPLYDGGIKNQVLEGGSPARPGQELPSHQQGSQ